MTTFTESNYTVNNPFPFNPKPNNNPKKEWFDEVYVCIEKQNNLNLNAGFYCYSFNSFENANNFKNMKLSLKPNLKATLIPICKWVPLLFHRYFLHLFTFQMPIFIINKIEISFHYITILT
jgi:hypothetical protein